MEMVNDLSGDSIESRVVDRAVTSIRTFEDGAPFDRAGYSAGAIKSAEGTTANYPK